MSSDVIREPTWNRLHVARRVRDIAKSMIRLSMLGRSIFPILCLPDPGVEEPAIRLKVSEDVGNALHIPATKPYPRFLVFAGAHEGRCRASRRVRGLRTAGRGVPALPPSPRDPRSEGVSRGRGGGPGWRPGPAQVRGGALPPGSSPGPPPGKRRKGPV